MTKITLFACILLACSQSLQAQTIPPDKWESYLLTNDTILVSDTFRMQTFSGSTQDNWNYKAEGRHGLIKPSEAEVSVEGKLLKILPDCNLFFDYASPLYHKLIELKFEFTCRALMLNEDLDAILYTGDIVEEVNIAKAINNNFALGLKLITVKNRNLLSGIGFRVGTKAHNSLNGFYAFNYIYLYGNISRYSLFKGEGTWKDTTAWSNLPAERHRHALVKGNVAVNTPIQCDEVSLDGELAIAEKTLMHVKDLNLYGHSSIRNKGQLKIDGRLSLNHSFPEKGVWYFVSFPFDVYADGVDSGFTLKDDTPNAGGNFFYALTYNGVKRNQTKARQTAWEPVSESALSEEQPIFQKNKGYLLAIDAKAEGTSITFTSRAGETPETFGRRAELSIDVPYIVEENNEHAGWQLCGNPLPSPLSISQLKNQSHDNHIYLFNGQNYTPVSMDEDFYLPPYSAFFLKVKESLSLPVEVVDRLEKSPAFLAASPLRTLKKEPVTQSAVSSLPVLERQAYRLTDSGFIIDQALESGKLYILDAVGRCLSTQTFNEGESLRIPLPDRSGFYILLLQTQNRRAEYKFVR